MTSLGIGFPQRVQGLRRKTDYACHLICGTSGGAHCSGLLKLDNGVPSSLAQ
jgi:hypothetical protein